VIFIINLLRVVWGLQLLWSYREKSGGAGGKGLFNRNAQWPKLAENEMGQVA